MLDEMNNFQHIGSNRMKRLQHIGPMYYVVQETFNHCDRITDKTLPIVFPMQNVDRQNGRQCTNSKGYAPPAIPPPIASEKSIQLELSWHNGLP